MKTTMPRKNRIFQLCKEGLSKEETLEIINLEYPREIEWAEGKTYKSSHRKDIDTVYYETLGYWVPWNKTSIQNELDEKRYPEGKKAYALHVKTERNSGLTEKLKQDRLDKEGDLECDVCGFSFSKTYGEVGKGFIEAHHLIPLSEGERESAPEDFALVCSNCHRMLHSGKTCLTIDKLKDLISNDKKTD